MTAFGCDTGMDAENTHLNAAPSSASQLLNLVRNTGNSNQILSGQESLVWGTHDQFGHLYPTQFDEHALNATGEMPAIFASDFGDFRGSDVGRRYKTRDLALRYANEGSIVSLSYHMCAPDYNDGCGDDFGQGIKLPGYSSSKIDQILTPGTSLNRTHMQRLDEVAGYLLDLKRAGVPVLWRPFHEMNGDWFWWGQQPRYKELWIQMYNHFQAKGLDNLVWVWSVNYWWKNNAEENPNLYYPGSQYVDVLGVDIYEDFAHGHRFVPNDAQHVDIYNGIKAVDRSKPIGISENGLIPDWPSLSRTQPDWAFYITWWGYEEHSSPQRYQNNYNSGLVLTQDDLGSSSPSTGGSKGNNGGGSTTSGDCVDTAPYGDGWGWNGSEGCRIGEDNSGSDNGGGVSTSGNCVDTAPYGDGWGWNGTSSCRIGGDNSGNNNGGGASGSSNCVDTAPVGDGWGWDGTSSCRISN